MKRTRMVNEVERKLKKLRQHLMKEKFKNMDLSAKSKDQVLEKIRAAEAKKNRVFPTFWWKNGLSVAVCMVLLVGGISIAGEHSGQKSKNPPSSGQNHLNGKTEKTSKKESKAQSYPPIKDPGPLSKDEIQNRMLHTQDYFTTAQGSYTSIVNHHKSIIQYEIFQKEGRQVRSYSQTTVPGIGVLNVQVVNGSNEMEVSPHNRSFQKIKIQQGGPFGAHIGASFNSITPKVESFLIDKKRWHVVNQNTIVAGQKAVWIKGDSDRQTQRTFEFWISRATGILLKAKLYDENGNVTYSLNTTKIQLNQPLNFSKFNIQIPKGYTDQVKRMMQEMKPDPRAAKIKELGGAKRGSGNVDQVFKNVKSHIPFLYTFKGADIYLYSAGLEKYKKYDQTTLAFIPDYQKNQVAKKGTSKLLCVQEYNRNSFINQQGNDFVTAKEFKKHSLSSFIRNGITWKGYTVRKPHVLETYMMGTKGKYIYEVVGQNLTFDKVKTCLEAFRKE